jgi:hypothetical protein
LKRKKITSNDNNRAHNLDLAFKTAEKIGISPLLDVEDMIDIPKPDE